MSDQIIKPLDAAANRAESVRKTSAKNQVIPIIMIPLGLIIMYVVDYISNGHPSQLGVGGFLDFITFGHEEVKMIDGEKIIESIPGVTWITDPFLLAIFLVFTWAQVKAIFSLKKVAGGAEKVSALLTTLRSMPERSSLGGIKEKILGHEDGHLRDVVVRWLDLGQQGESDQFSTMMDNAALRRAEGVDKDVNGHVAINRTMLKLGFIGTLIGLAMTFPPMKEAIQSLNIAGEEGSFVMKIANAIDGDAYAILTTLLATAFSVFIELLTIQAFKNMYADFEMVNNNVDEWCLIELIPWINELKIGNDEMDKELALQRKFQEEMLALKRQFLEEMLTLQKQQSSEMQTFQKETTEQFAQVQGEIRGKVIDFQTETTSQISANQAKITDMQGNVSKNVADLGSSVQDSGQQMEKLVPIQKAFGERVEELAAYERQYRSFLQAQGNVNIPTRLKPEA
ncbi:MAG: hypothetical protein OCD01_09030 [Fibrobacterales bacterium]